MIHKSGPSTFEQHIPTYIYKHILFFNTDDFLRRENRHYRLNILLDCIIINMYIVIKSMNILIVC